MAERANGSSVFMFSSTMSHMTSHCWMSGNLITKCIEEIDGEWQQTEQERKVKSYESIFPLSDKQHYQIRVEYKISHKSVI